MQWSREGYYIQERDEFHSTRGLFFKRMEDGSVRVRSASTSDVEVREWTLPATMWASVVATVSILGEDNVSWKRALEAHNNG